MRIESRTAFFQALGVSPNPPEVSHKDALAVALDERARELEFYWKRTTYAWTLTGAVFAGYFALAKEAARDYSVLGVVACIGVVSSVAWWCLNRGSKYWQENWELQVDLLELEHHGPLHRINPDVAQYRLWKIHRPYPFSVTKINQLLSLFVVVVWLVLLVDDVRQLAWSWRSGSPVLGVVITLSAVTCVSFLWLGRSTPHHSVLSKDYRLIYEPVAPAVTSTQGSDSDAPSREA